MFFNHSKKKFSDRENNKGGVSCQENEESDFLCREKKIMSFRSCRGASNLVRFLIPVSVILLSVCIIFGVMLILNRNSGNPGNTSPNSTQQVKDTLKTDQSEESAKKDTEPSAAGSSQGQAASVSAATAAETAVTASTAQSSVVPSISNPDNMYSSYAYLVSFDPVTGWAKFDYFDMLTGKDAVKWLVEEKGYSQADAEAEVNNFGDGEFVEKNVNTQLRTADMKTVTIKMMYHADGTDVNPLEPVATTYSEFQGLCAAHSDSVFHSYFYYVTVGNGAITEVDQVYWS